VSQKKPPGLLASIDAYSFGVFDEGLSNEDTCVINERVDATEASEGLLNDMIGRLRITDISGDRQYLGIRRRLDGS
jgi:hypothetical protein